MPRAPQVGEPAPATFVIEAADIVRYAHVRGNWTERVEAEVVLTVLDELSRDAG